MARMEKKRKMDANTRKLRDDLEARERNVKRARKDEENDKIALQQEIERLREDGLRKLREMVHFFLVVALQTLFHDFVGTEEASANS